MKDKLSLPLLASISALTPLAVDMYLPAIPAIAESLNSEISIIQNSLSIFLVGFGLGLLFFGPCSDRFGRRPMAIFGLVGFLISGFILSLSTSAEMFLTFRLLQGFLGGASTVVIPAMIRDCYGKDTAKGMSAVAMIMLLAPLIAPLIGSFLLSFGDWRTIFQALSVYAVIVLAITISRLPETKPEDEHSAPFSFFRNYKIILAKKIVYLDLISFMLTSFIFFTYITSASFIYITYFGVSETRFGILFSSTAASLILANMINIRYVSKVGARKMMQLGLASGLSSTLALVVVSSFDLSLYWTLVCFACMIFSLGLSSINANALVLIEFPNQASSASAVTGVLRFGIGALAGPILAVIYNGTSRPIAIMMCCTMLAACLTQLIRAKFLTNEQ